MATIESDVDRISHLAHGSTTGPANIHVAARRRVDSLTVVADAAAGDTRSSDMILYPAASKGVSAYLMPHAALTESDTLYATVTLELYTAAGAESAALATFTTKKAASGGSGSWVAGTPITFSSFAGDAIAAGYWVGLKVEKASTGTALPACSLVIVTDLT